MSDDTTLRTRIAEVVEEIIHKWVDTAYRTVATSLFDDDPARRALDEMRHLHLAEPWIPAHTVADAVIRHFHVVERTLPLDDEDNDE